MSGPVAHIAKSVAADLKAAMDDSEGWKFFEENLLPAAMADTYRPDDRVMTSLARFAATLDGRDVVAWLRSISDRAPYPFVTGGNLEHAALGAAKHEGRAHVGHLIEKAIREGQRLIDASSRGGQ
jgi:hypothetical protein